MNLFSQKIHDQPIQKKKKEKMQSKDLSVKNWDNIFHCYLHDLFSIVYLINLQIKNLKSFGSYQINY